VSECDGRVSASATLKRMPLAASVPASIVLVFLAFSLWSACLSGLPGGCIYTKLNLGGRFAAMPRVMVPE
jgi:hypothetical protein